MVNSKPSNTGRSNAINIAERLGLPNAILHNAREQYGAASAEINEVILDMERLKQNLHERIHEAQNYLKISRDIHENLQVTRRRVMDHGMDQTYRKVREISEMAAMARSILHKKVRQIRASATQASRPTVVNDGQYKSTINSQRAAGDSSELSRETKAAYSFDNARQSSPDKQARLPNVGDMVHISSLNKEATVLKVEPSKEEILVQVGKMKLKLKLAEVAT